MVRSTDHSSAAPLSTRWKSFVLAAPAWPSAKEKLPRLSCRPMAYGLVTLDWAAPAEAEAPSDSAMTMVSVGFRTDENLLGPVRVDLLTQRRPFSPYMK